MAQNIQDGNLHVKGRITCEQMTVPAGAVSNASIASDAAIESEKLEHRIIKDLKQPNSAATTETRGIHIAKGAGTVEAFDAGSIAKAVGDSTVTVDLKKNGSTILIAVITLDNANTNRVAEAGVISSPTYAAGDWFEVVITAVAGTGTLPTGVFAQAAFNERA